jgi:NAD-dependent dihydropyrimidine dehydrogenase PreA subunit
MVYKIDKNGVLVSAKVNRRHNKVSLPDKIVTIGNSAFSNSEFLEKVYVPESVTTIEDSAFKNCKFLNEVVLPSKINRLGTTTFYNCIALQIINQNPREYLLFNECERRGKFDFDCDITGDKISSVLCEDFKYSKFLGNIKSGSNGKFKREYNAIQKRPIISAKQCKGCKVCSNSCPMQAINIQSNQLGETAVINREKCINCLKCVDNCPYKIIKVKTPCKHYHIERMIKKHSKTNKGINE